MLESRGQPSRTARACRDGCILAGDLAVADQHGLWRIAGAGTKAMVAGVESLWTTPVLLSRTSGRRIAGVTLAEFVDWVQVAGDLQQGTSVPLVAISRLIRRHRLSPDQVAVLEINEAFAVTPIVGTRLLASALPVDAETLMARTNIHGGVVARGHPPGASGVRIVMPAAEILRQRGGGRAL